MFHCEQQDRYALILRFFNNMDRFRCVGFAQEPFAMAHDTIFIWNIRLGGMNLPQKKLMAAFRCHAIPKPTLYNPHKY